MNIPTDAPPTKKQPSFDYDAAFSRNLGLVQPEEQQKLRSTKVAIAGLGGVGGVHALALARLGIGKFHIADFDTFEVHNFNRQSGAMMSTIDRPKSEVMKEMILDINPEAEVTEFKEGINQENISDFLEGVDVGIDGLDYFATDARDCFYKETYDKHVPVVAAGPIGCSSALLVFMPDKMSWHKYFAMDLAKTDFDKYVLFALGTAPKATHMSYMDRSYVDLENKKGPSLSSAVQLCSGVVATEVMKIVTGRGKIYAAPYYHQFDAFKCKYIRGRLINGNRGLIQRLKFSLFRKLYRPAATTTNQNS